MPRPSVTPTRILPSGAVDWVISSWASKRDVFHGFGVFEQRFAGRGQFIALGVLDKQRGAEALFDGLDVPGHGGVGGVQTAGSGEQTPAALQFEKKPQVIPVEHESSLKLRC